MKRGVLAGMAVKNLLRYGRRTFITSLVLAVGIASYILLDSLLIGTRRESELGLIHYEMARARLVTPGYWEEWKERPLDQAIPDPEPLTSALSAMGVPWAIRTEFLATAVVRSDPGGSFPVLVTALDFREDVRTVRVTQALSEGRFPEPGEEAAVLGQWMAQDFGLEPGDELTLQFTDRWGGREAMDVAVTGIVNTPNALINREGFFIPHDTADWYLGLDGSAGMILIDLPQNSRASRDVGSRIASESVFAPVELHGWRDWSWDYLIMADGDKYGSAVILFLVFIIASVGLANTMLMSVMERQREIGMMRSLGMKESQVFRLFLMEAAGIGLIGSLGGIVIALLVNIPLVRYGIDFTWLMRDFSIGYRFTGVIYGVWSAQSYAIGLAAGIAICIAVTWISIRRIAGKSITDEIRSA